MMQRLEKRIFQDEKINKTFTSIPTLSKATTLKTITTAKSIIKSQIKLQKAGKPDAKNSNRRIRKNVRRARLPLVKLLGVNFFISMLVAAVFIIVLQFSSYLDTSTMIQLRQNNECKQLKVIFLLAAVKVENKLKKIFHEPEASDFIATNEEQLIKDGVEKLERIFELNVDSEGALRDSLENYIFNYNCENVIKFTEFFASSKDCRSFRNGVLDKG
jgi:hypothetical protein